MINRFLTTADLGYVLINSVDNEIFARAFKKYNDTTLENISNVIQDEIFFKVTRYGW